MKIGLCCIAKNENRYIKEFVEHYKKIGFSQIFLYDNNDVNGEKFDTVIKDYIDSNFVNVTNFRGRKLCMFDAYNDCYQKHQDFDWIAFFDCDEFLTLSTTENIEQFLSLPCFQKSDVIGINWMLYGDNDLVYYEDKPLSERFTKPLDYDFYLLPNKFENRQFKCIVKTRLNIKYMNPHFPHGIFNATNSIGQNINVLNMWDYPYVYENAHLKHYRTKTVSEYVEKIVRGYPDIDEQKSKWLFSEDVFFKYNKRTEEKEKIFRGENQNMDIFICAHKDFVDYPKNDVYKIIHGQEKINIPLTQIQEKIDKDNPLRNKQQLYGEGSRIYHIWKNEELKDYVGICHYSRFFEFYDHIPQMDEIFKAYDIVLPKPLYVGNVYQQYGMCHNIEDLNLIFDIIKCKYPQYTNSAIKTLNSPILFVGNMFIMRKEDFIEYCTFVFGILEQFDKIRIFTDMANVEKYIKSNSDKYLKNFSPNNTIEYQRRMDGFLMERLSNIFIHNKFKNPKIFNILNINK